jgi:hypothetical protein
MLLVPLDFGGAKPGAVGGIAAHPRKVREDGAPSIPLNGKIGVSEVVMSTTYIFGAGASLHAGYPLVSTMGESWLDFMLHIPLPQFQSDAQSLIDTFGKSPKAEDFRK